MFRAAVSLSVLLVSIASARAESPPPRATYVEADPAKVTVVGGTIDAPILFLNRCAAGCTLTPGYEDSRENRSSIIESPVFIPPFDSGDAAWAAVVDCVRGIYADFEIRVTDQDPGSEPHFEAIVAGRPDDAGFPYYIGGVAPFTCGVIDNAITFTFAAVYGRRPQQICQVVAQETAHAFGLDHELLCEDPMTYLEGCGPKCFQDLDAACGESEARPCYCGDARQNSWQTIRGLFGTAASPAQAVRFSSPEPGSQVSPGFHVELSASIACLAQIEAWIGDDYLGAVEVWPYLLDTPLDLPVGPATIRAVATDRDGTTYEASIEVVVGTAPEPPPPPPPMVDAGTPAIDDPDPPADCGCAMPVDTDGDFAGWVVLLAAVAVGLRRRRPR